MAKAICSRATLRALEYKRANVCRHIYIYTYTYKGCMNINYLGGIYIFLAESSGNKMACYGTAVAVIPAKYADRKRQNVLIKCSECPGRI